MSPRSVPTLTSARATAEESSSAAAAIVSERIALLALYARIALENIFFIVLLLSSMACF
jgi:hypothetical protein